MPNNLSDTVRFSYFTEDEVSPMIEEGRSDEVLNSNVSLRADKVEVEEQFARQFYQKQADRFVRYMDKYRETLLERHSAFQKEPNSERTKKQLTEKLHQYSLTFLDFTVEAMQEMFGWDDAQAEKATYLLYTHAVKPHEEFLVGQLGKTDAEIVATASQKETENTQQFNTVYMAGKTAREENKNVLDVLKSTPIDPEAPLKGKDIYLNQAGWYATEATFAFAETLIPEMKDSLPDLLLELFSLTDAELQELVENPESPAELVKAQIVMFALQAANLTWIQIQPFRAVQYGDMNRIDTKDAPYFKPFIHMSKEKEWPAILLDRDQILRGILTKKAEQSTT